MPERGPEKQRKTPAEPVGWDLRLYVAGQTVKIPAGLRQPEEDLRGTPGGQLSDRGHRPAKNPQLAAGDQILALPTLVRKLPEPVRKIVGTLSNTERVLVGLDLRPRD